MERKVEVMDSSSTISSLKCGSILPDPSYNPVYDPRNSTCAPPAEICVRVNFEVPEWLRFDDMRESQSRRLNLQRWSSFNPTRRRIDYDISEEMQRVVQLNPLSPICPHRAMEKSSSETKEVAPLDSQNSFISTDTSNTTPTDVSSRMQNIDDCASPKRRPLLMLRLPFLLRRRRSGDISLRRPRGFFT